MTVAAARSKVARWRAPPARYAWLVWVALTMTLSGPARAYDIFSEPPAGRFAMNLDLGTEPVTTDGYGVTTWNALAQNALNAWNQAGIGPQRDHNFFSVQSPAVTGDACSQDGVNQVRFSATLCGLAFGSALGVTYKRSSNGKRVEADVVFDGGRAWNAYSGTLQAGVPDFYRVALHEFGHVAGLQHPDEDGQSKTALLNSQISNIDNLQADDIDGAHHIDWIWFDFTTQSGVAPDTAVTSNTIAVTGLSAPAAIGISGGEYSINGGPYTSAAGTVSGGQSVTLRVIASRAPLTAATATLSIGAAAGEFTAITAAGGPPVNVNASSYDFPAIDGASKTFLKNGSEVVVTTVLPGTSLINGVATRAFQTSEGETGYGTNDSDGIRDHREFKSNLYLPGLGFTAVTVTFSPPILETPAIATMGLPTVSTGNANYLIPAAGINSDLTYSSSVTLEGFETVAVPAGIFNTIRVRDSFNLSGSINGSPVNQSSTGTTWVASGIGTVKSVTYSGEVTTRVLTSTSLATDVTPDTISLAPQTGIPLNSLAESNAVTVSGINSPASISITAGEYSINGGSYTFAPGTVNSRDTVTVRLGAANTYSTTRSAILTIGGISGTFTVVTVANTSALSVPGAPANVVAIPGDTTATVSFSAPADNGGVAITSYTATSSPGGHTASGNGFLTVTGLTNGVAYTFTVTAANSAGSGAASAASNSVTPSANPTFTPALASGFNLLGNSQNTSLDVMSSFGNQTNTVVGITENVASVWKWDAINLKWQFHSPLLSTAANAAYAASHNYDVLTVIAAGEGYWVNALTALNLLPQMGAAFNWNGFSYANLPGGFNLIAHAGDVTPSQFNANVSVTPPAVGIVATDNFASLWAWDATNVTWFFYSPLLESSGGLPAVKNYADSHFFQHFQDFNKRLDRGVGFWVNKF